MQSFEYDQASFEFIANSVLALRCNVAFALAILNRRSFVSPPGLFGDVYCHTDFFRMGDFSIPQNGVRISPSGTQKKWLYKGDLDQATPIISTKGTLDDGRGFDITDFSTPELIRLGGQNVFDGLLKLTNTSNEKIMIWIDAKYTTDGNKMSISYLEPLIKKKNLLEKCLPDMKHFLLVISNRPLETSDPSDSKSFQWVTGKNGGGVETRTALICANNLMKAFSCVSAPFLIKQRNSS